MSILYSDHLLWTMATDNIQIGVNQLETLVAAMREELIDYHKFVRFVAEEVMCADEEWYNRMGSFQELACRQLVKLGIAKEKDGVYTYEEDDT